MDLIRTLLLRLDADKQLDGTRWIRFTSPAELRLADHSIEEVGYHLRILVEEGFLTGRVGMESTPVLNKLTWKGHEFIDDIRDDSVWGKTKERAKGLAGVGISLMWELAKAEAKKKLGLP